MSNKNNVTNIKYKQMDRNTEIKKTMNTMEELFLGKKGIGLMEHLGLTPGRIQKSLDEQFDHDFNKLLEEHKDFIFWESRKRSGEKMQDWLNTQSNEQISEDALTEFMKESLKNAELEVVKELVEKHL